MSGEQSDHSMCPACTDYIKESKSALSSFRPTYSQGWLLDHDLLCGAPNSKGEKVAKLSESGEVLSNREANLSTKNHQNKTLLHCAVELNVMEITKSLLQKNADIEARSHDDSTPLHIAARMGNTEIAEVLLDHGADANSVCASTLGTLLHIAVKQGKAALVETLLRKGTSMNANVKDEGTLLVLAAKRNHREVVKVLLNNGADINARDKDDENILSYVVGNSLLSLIELILEADADPKNNRGCFYTVVHGSVSETRSKILEALPLCGFGFNSENTKDLVWLHDAVCRGYPKIVEYLLNTGTNVNESMAYKRSYGGTPLHTAVLNNHPEIVRVFMKNKVNVNVKDRNGNTPLHDALTILSLDITKLLLAHGADLKGEPNVLHKAVRTMSKDFVEMLFQHEPTLNVNQRNKRGMTVLYHSIKACSSRYVEARGADSTVDNDTCIRDIAAILLDKGADVNARVKDGTTALHVAAEQGYQKVVELLLERKADVNAVHYDKETPLHCSARNGNEKILKILLDAGAMVNAKRTNGTPALYVAIYTGYAKAVKILMENGADIAVKNDLGSMSLHIAAAYSTVEILEMMLNVCEDVDCRDNDGMTALHVAARRGNPRIVKLLLDHDSDINLFGNNGKTPLNCVTFDLSSDDELHNDNMFDEVGNDHDDHNDYDDDVGYDYDEDYNDNDVYDEDDYKEDDDDAHKCDVFDARSDEVAEMLSQHIMKMIAMNRVVSGKNVRPINRATFDNYKKLHDNCKREIECMRQKKIGRSNVSYYDVLTNDMNRLAMYARNKDIVDALETDDHKDMCFYLDMLKIRFKKGQKRADLLDTSLKSLSFLTLYALPDLSTGKILSYLSNNDLKNVIKAGPCIENDRQYLANQT